MGKPLITKALRSELKTFQFSECKTCHETIIWAEMKGVATFVPLDPQPTHGTEMDRGYARHTCPVKADE